MEAESDPIGSADLPAVAAAILSEVPAESTAPELDRLAVLERAIEDAQRSFIPLGLALAEIRDRQLFRATHRSFRAYLLDRWGFRQEFAFATIYGARCAQAIIAEHGDLPAGLAPEALKPLWPLLNGDGPEAVAKAWTAVLARYGARQRPPSRSEVRAVLFELGCATIAPERPRVQIGQVGASLETAVAHVARVRQMLRGRPLPPPARRRAAAWARLARDLAADLEALADGRAAAKRLAAVESGARPGPEPRPTPGTVFCDHHGRTRDERGICEACGILDRPAARYL